MEPIIKGPVGPGFPTLRFSEGAWAGRSVSLDFPLVTLGRGIENDIVLQDPGISRKHCHFIVRPGQILLIDLDSTNGTSVNAQRVERAELRDGDKVVLGTAVTFRFLMLSPEERELERKLSESANKDAATGVHHQQAWLEQAESLVPRFCRRNRPISLALCVVDQYQRVSQDLGPSAGNALLLELCRKTRALGREALVGRLQAGVIALLLPGFAHARALQRMQKLGQDVARHPIEVGPQRLQPATLSIGLASTHYLVSLESLLSEAQGALAEAIQGGHHEVVVRLLEGPSGQALRTTTVMVVKQKRKAIRTAYHLPILVISEQGDFAAQLIDLGLGGMRIHIEQPMSPGWPIEVALQDNPGRTISMIVKWQRGQQCGLRFLDPQANTESSWVSEVLTQLGHVSLPVSDRREHTRVTWSAKFRLRTDQMVYEGEAVSLGHGGLSAQSPLPPPLNVEGLLESDQLVAPVRVTWVSNSRFGLQFGALNPTEQQRLFELVRLALG